MTVFALALLVAAPALPITHADFRLGAQSAQQTATARLGTAGTPLPIAPSADQSDPGVNGADGAEAEPDGSPVSAPTHSHFLIARGFGKGIPLAFIVRQVVPPHVRVSYGHGVNQQQPVSWVGGKPWDQVLRTALKPVGLHVVMAHMAVEIDE